MASSCPVGCTACCDSGVYNLAWLSESPEVDDSEELGEEHADVFDGLDDLVPIPEVSAAVRETI